MGENILFQRVEIIQGGLLQIDFRLEEQEITERMFINAKDFFSQLGESMSKSADKWAADFENKYKDCT